MFPLNINISLSIKPVNKRKWLFRVKKGRKFVTVAEVSLQGDEPDSFFIITWAERYYTDTYCSHVLEVEKKIKDHCIKNFCPTNPVF